MSSRHYFDCGNLSSPQPTSSRLSGVCASGLGRLFIPSNRSLFASGGPGRAARDQFALWSFRSPSFPPSFQSIHFMLFKFAQ